MEQPGHPVGGKLPQVLWTAPMLLLLFSVPPRFHMYELPDGFFVYTGLATCLAAIIIAIVRLKTDRENWPGWVLVGVAILYNPAWPINLDLNFWALLKVLTAGLFIYIGWLNLGTAAPAAAPKP